MKILFLDDSFLSTSSLLGYGGFVVDAHAVRSLSDDLCEVKRQKRIPLTVELKWSPSAKHFLRSSFKGSRHELYKEALNLLKKYDARLFCIIHDVSQCYGVRIHGWNLDQTKIWASKEQMKYLSERFQHTILSNNNDVGIIISDNYESRKGEEAITKQATFDLQKGTMFQKLDRISTIPLMADSKYCYPIQLADLVTGITVAYFCEGKYASELFPEIAKLFAYDRHLKSTSFVSTFTASVLGVGIKLFPFELKKKMKKQLDALDNKYLISSQKGIYDRIQPSSIK